jgi:WD40 repeat protein
MSASIQRIPNEAGPVWQRRRLLLGVLVGLAIILALIVIWVLLSPTTTKPQGPQPIILWTTASPVTSISFSPDDQILAAGLHDGSVELRRVGDGELLHTLKGHTGEVSVAAFSPDGRILASGESFRVAHAGVVGNIPTAAIQLWSVQDGMLLHALPGHELAVETLAFSPDGQILASNGPRGGIRIWTTVDGQMQSEFKAIPIPWFESKLVFTSDGQELTLADGGGVVRQWRVSSENVLHTYNDPYITVGGVPRSLDISRDGRIFVASNTTDPDVYVWQVGSDHILIKYGGHRNFVEAIALSPDAQFVASAGDYELSRDHMFVVKDNAIHIWRAANAEEVSVLQGFDGTVTGLAWSSDNTLLASGFDDATVRLWRVK